MKRFLLLAALSIITVIGLTSNSFALGISINVGWDVGTDYDSDGNSLTEDLNQFDANIGSWVKQSKVNPGTFTEYGVFKIDTLYAADGTVDDVEGFTSNNQTKYSITGILDNLNGAVTYYGLKPGSTTQYQLNYSLYSDGSADGDLHLYLQDGYISGDVAEDINTYYTDTGIYGGYGGALAKYQGTASEKFADFSIEKAEGTIIFDGDIMSAADPTLINIVAGGSFAADFDIVPGNTNWLWNGTTFADWEALGHKFGAQLSAVLAHNTGNSIIAGYSATDIDILTDLRDSTTFTHVPEPTTLLLFGFGLLGLAGVSRKKMA